MNRYFVSEKIGEGFFLRSNFEHLYFFMLHISIFTIIKNLDIFLMAKYISFFEALF